MALSIAHSYPPGGRTKPIPLLVDDLLASDGGGSWTLHSPCSPSCCTASISGRTPTCQCPLQYGLPQDVTQSTCGTLYSDAADPQTEMQLTLIHPCKISSKQIQPLPPVAYPACCPLRWLTCLLSSHQRCHITDEEAERPPAPTGLKAESSNRGLQDVHTNTLFQQEKRLG